MRCTTTAADPSRSTSCAGTRPLLAESQCTSRTFTARRRRTSHVGVGQRTWSGLGSNQEILRLRSWPGPLPSFRFEAPFKSKRLRSDLGIPSPPTPQTWTVFLDQKFSRSELDINRGAETMGKLDIQITELTPGATFLGFQQCFLHGGPAAPPFLGFSALLPRLVRLQVQLESIAAANYALTHHHRHHHHHRHRQRLHTSLQAIDPGFRGLSPEKTKGYFFHTKARK